MVHSIVRRFAIAVGLLMIPTGIMWAVQPNRSQVAGEAEAILGAAVVASLVEIRGNRGA